MIKFIKIDQVNKAIQALENLNVDWIRIEFDFFEYLKNKKLNYELYDNFLKKVLKSKIKVLGLISGKVPGNLMNLIDPKRKYPFVLDKLTEYKNFLNILILRYKKYINHWEIWNEENSLRFWINLPSPKEYLKLLSISSEIIKTQQKSAKIVFGGIMGDDRKKLIFFQYLNFFKDSCKNKTKKLFDVTNFHPYDFDCYLSFKSAKSFFRKYEKIFLDTINYSRKYSNKKIFFTEFGISRKFTKFTNKEIAKIYFDLLKLCEQEKVVLFLWTLVGPYGFEYSCLNPETEFCLLNKKMEPLPLYKELKKKFI